MPLFNQANILNIPQEMRDQDRWVNFRLQPDRKDPHRQLKIPVDPKNPRKNASATGADTWGSFAQALGNAAQEPERLGIGFVFTAESPEIGLDLDKCILADGSFTSGAQALLTKLSHSYAERSVSGTGVHVYGYGAVEHAVKTPLGELYGEKRYFVVTGDALEGHAAEVAEWSPELLAWIACTLEASRGTGAARSAHTEKTRTRSREWETLELEDDEQPPSFELFSQLFDLTPEAHKTWEKRRSFPSASEYEMSLARFAALSGWPAQEIFRLLRAWRAKWGEEAKPLDYYKRTIYKAAHEEVTPDPETMSQEEKQAHVVSVVGLPVARFIRVGLDDPHYHIVLEDKTRIDLGQHAEMIKQATWQALAFARGTYAETRTRRQWSATLAMLVDIMEKEDSTAMGKSAETRAWIEDFTKNIPLSTRKSYEIVKNEQTFYDDAGNLYVHLGQLLHHIKIVAAPGIGQSQLASRLRVIGWKTVQVNAREASDKHANKGYWTPE